MVLEWDAARLWRCSAAHSAARAPPPNCRLAMGSLTAHPLLLVPGQWRPQPSLVNKVKSGHDRCLLLLLLVLRHLHGPSCLPAGLHRVHSTVAVHVHLQDATQGLLALSNGHHHRGRPSLVRSSSARGAPLLNPCGCLRAFQRAHVNTCVRVRASTSVHIWAWPGDHAKPPSSC